MHRTVFLLWTHVRCLNIQQKRTALKFPLALKSLCFDRCDHYKTRYYKNNLSNLYQLTQLTFQYCSKLNDDVFRWEYPQLKTLRLIHNDGRIEGLEWMTMPKLESLTLMMGKDQDFAFTNKRTEPFVLPHLYYLKTDFINYNFYTYRHTFISEQLPFYWDRYFLNQSSQLKTMVLHIHDYILKLLADFLILCMQHLKQLETIQLYVDSSIHKDALFLLQDTISQQIDPLRVEKILKFSDS